MKFGAQPHLRTRFRFFTWLLAGVWTVCAAGSLLWNLRQYSDQSLEIAGRTARVTFQNRLVLGHAGLWLVGLASIGIFRRTVGQGMLAREQARAELQREVAERQRAESQLREANDRYERVLAGAGAGLWDWDVPNHKVEYSPRWKALRGFAEHEVSDSETEWSSAIHPDDAPRVMAAVQAHFAGQTPVFVEEYRVRRKDGSWIWIADRGLAWRDAEGRVLRMTGSETDIMERKAAEEALRESERRFRQVAESLPQLVWTCEAGGPCDYLSPQWVRYTGKSDAEQLGYGWLEQLHPDDRQRTIVQWQATAAKGENFEIEFRIRRHDGAYRWFRTLAVPLRDEAGRVVKWFGSNTDVDDMKRAEDVVRRSEARWNAAIENFAAGAIIATEDEQLIYWNPAAREMHGFTRPDEGLESLENTRLTFQLWTSDDARLLERDEWPMRRIQRGETVRNLELRIRRLDQGWEKVFSYSGAMVETAAGERLIFLSVYDLTELRQAEAALRESRRAALNLRDDAVAARQQAEQTLVSLRQVQEDLDRAQEVGQIGSWRLDVRRDVLTWSDENHRIFGVPKGTPLTYETFLGIVHPDDRQYVDTRWQASLRGETYDIDHRLVVDGRVKWVREKAYLEVGAAGELLGAFGITEDITDRKRAEEELRRAKEDWERTFDAVPDLIAILDREHRVIRANRAMAERLNLTPEQCVGMRCYEVVHGTSQPPESCPHLLSCRDCREHSIELEGTRLAGQFMVTTSPQFDGQGRVVGTVHVARDISHLKQTEKALQRLNAELEQRVAERTSELARASAYNRSLIEAAVDPLVTIGPDGKITDVNAATEAATGRTRKELIGTDFSDYFTQPEKAREGYQQVFREGFVRDYPLEIRHHAGGTTSVLYNASVYRDETGKVIGVFAAARDITKRLRAERALREERQRLYDLLETLPVYVALLSEDHHVPFTNRFFRERFGESQGRRCFEFLFQRTNPCENCKAYKVLSTHAPSRWEWTGPDGRNYDIYDFPFVDTDGSTMILEMGIDITERRKAQRAVEASEARYRSFVTASTLLSWTTDSQGLVAGDMPSWRAFTGQSLEQVQGWGWADAVHPDDRQRTTAIWSQAVASRSLYAVEYRLRRHDGQYRWLSVRGVPVLEGDTVREWVGACTDITERKLAEEETRRMRQELGHVDRVARLGELTSSLAHELNQPLAAILSNAQAARRFLASDSPDLDLFREILDDIIQDDKRAGSVIHRLRLMLQKGKQEPETFPINDAIREVVQLLHSEAVGRNAALAVDLPDGLPAVWAGRVEFQQVMVNLLLNALDAVGDVPPDRREISIRTRLDEDAVVVAVRDRGCGLPTADFNSIFEPFFTTKPTGLGMGLAICRRMVQAQGGRIWAANNDDAGATVSFSLPSAAANRGPSHD